MLRFIFTITATLLLSACSQHNLVINSVDTNATELTSQTISRIAIPIREKGYSNFKTEIIKTQKSLDNFVNTIKKQKNWSKKENFLKSLLLKKINFKDYNLIIYRMNMPSKSTVLLVDAPTGNSEEITITIGEEKAEMKTNKMAYYALAYKFEKSVKRISFDRGTEKTTIQTKD